MPVHAMRPKDFVEEFVTADSASYGRGFEVPELWAEIANKKGPLKGPFSSTCSAGECRKLVRSRGLEPPRVSPLPPQGSASANFATFAQKMKVKIYSFKNFLTRKKPLPPLKKSFTVSVLTAVN